MDTINKIIVRDKEMDRVKIRDFIYEGLKDVKDGRLLEFDQVFNELEERYADL